MFVYIVRYLNTLFQLHGLYNVVWNQELLHGEQ
jgi:hypothetical protein